MEDSKKLFQAIELDDKVIESISKNKKVVAKLSNIIGLAGGKAEKTQGNLLYALSTKLLPTQDGYTQSFVDCIMSKKWTKVQQLEEAIAFLKSKLSAEGDKYVINQAEFEEASGVGIVCTEEDCKNLVNEAFDHFKKDIDELKYDFKWNLINFYIKEKNKWADSKTVMALIQQKQVELLGEKP